MAGSRLPFISQIITLNKTKVEPTISVLFFGRSNMCNKSAGNNKLTWTVLGDA